MNGADLIAIAGNLVANPSVGNAEARYRSAVSRAYYGVFHEVLSVLNHFGVSVPKNHSGHQEAYRKLHQSGITIAVEAASILDTLRGDRNEADYSLHKPRFSKQANAIVSLESAHDAMACLRKCLEEPARSELAIHFEETEQ